MSDAEMHDLHRKLWKAWEKLHKSIGHENPISIQTNLQRTFDELTGKHLPAQLVLIAANRAVLVVPSGCENWEKRKSTEGGRLSVMFQQLLLEFLGTEFKADSPLLKLPPNLYFGRRLDPARESPPKHTGSVPLTGEYDIYPVNLYPGRPGQVDLLPTLGRPSLRSTPLPLPGVSPELAKRIKPWLKNIVISLQRWEETSHFPRTIALAAFLMRNESDATPSELLMRYREKLEVLAVFVGAAGFIYRTFAFSEASARDSRSLRDAFALKWVDHFRNEARDEPEGKDEYPGLPFERILFSILRYDRPFVVRSVLAKSDIGGREKGMIATLKALESLLAVVSKETVVTNNDAFKRIQEYFPRTPDEVEVEVRHKRILSQLTFSAIRNTFALYERLPETAPDAFLAQVMLPVVTALLAVTEQRLEILRTRLSFPRESRGITVSGVRNLALAVAEELFALGNSTLRTAVFEVIKAYVHERIDSNSDSAHLTRLAMTALYLCSELPAHQLTASEDIAVAILRHLESPLDGPARLFHKLPPERRRSLRSRSDQFPVSISEQFCQIDDDQMSIKDQRDKAGDWAKALHAYAFISTKGGVGKTTAALGVASWLSEQSYKVAIVDLDFFGPTLGRATNHVNHNASYLNDFVWGHALDDIKKLDATSEIHTDVDNIFAKRTPMRDRYENFHDISSILTTSCGVGPTVICASPQYDAQELMRHLLSGDRSLFAAALRDLFIDLALRGYNHVILDCPAELKDVTEIASAQVALFPRGVNVFVGTTYYPSMMSLLELLPRSYYSHGRNHLLLNKVRRLDRQYFEDKEAFLWYLLSEADQDDEQYDIFLSQPIQSLLLNVERVNAVDWSEALERLPMSAPGLQADDFKELARHYRCAGKAILHTATGGNGPRKDGETWT